MQRERLKSKAILSAGYDPSAQELELEFQSGHVYRYENVPASVYDWLVRVENKGGFVRRMIAGRYVERAVPRADRAAASEVAAAPESLEDTLRASLHRLREPPP